MTIGQLGWLVIGRNLLEWLRVETWGNLILTALVWTESWFLVRTARDKMMFVSVTVISWVFFRKMFVYKRIDEAYLWVAFFYFPFQSVCVPVCLGACVQAWVRARALAWVREAGDKHFFPVTENFPLTRSIKVPNRLGTMFSTYWNKDPQ